jgi:hypothetical protein
MSHSSTGTARRANHIHSLLRVRHRSIDFLFDHPQFPHDLKEYVNALFNVTCVILEHGNITMHLYILSKLPYTHLHRACLIMSHFHDLLLIYSPSTQHDDH